VGRAHLKAWTVKWYILTLVVVQCWNFRDKFENKIYSSLNEL